MQIQLGCPHTWQLVGLYQNEVSSENEQSREVILPAMEAILTRAKASNHRVLFLDDVTSVPAGGRWGYSPSSKLAEQGRATDNWVHRQGWPLSGNIWSQAAGYLVQEA